MRITAQDKLNDAHMLRDMENPETIPEIIIKSITSGVTSRYEQLASVWKGKREDVMTVRAIVAEALRLGEIFGLPLTNLDKENGSYHAENRENEDSDYLVGYWQGVAWMLAVTESVSYQPDLVTGVSKDHFVRTRSYILRVAKTTMRRRVRVMKKEAAGRNGT